MDSDTVKQGVIVRPRVPPAIELKLAKIDRQRAQTKETYELIGKLLDNPILEMIAWYFFIEYVNQHQGEGWLTDLSINVFAATGMGVITAKALAPAMPLIGQGVGAIAGVAKLAAL